MLHTKNKKKAKTMEMTSSIEPVTLTDILDLATWNRPRSTQELQDFIATRHNQLPSDTEIS